MFLKLPWNCRVFSSETTPIWTEKLKFRNTVDGRNPAPGEVGKCFPLFTGFYTSKRWLFYLRISEPWTPVYRLTTLPHYPQLLDVSGPFAEGKLSESKKHRTSDEGLTVCVFFHQIWTRKRDSFLWPSFFKNLEAGGFFEIVSQQ